MNDIMTSLRTIAASTLEGAATAQAALAEIEKQRTRVAELEHAYDALLDECDEAGLDELVERHRRDPR